MEKNLKEWVLELSRDRVCMVMMLSRTLMSSSRERENVGVEMLSSGVDAVTPIPSVLKRSQRQPNNRWLNF